MSRFKYEPSIVIKTDIVDTYITHKGAYCFKVKEKFGYGIYDVDLTNECQIVDNKLEWEKNKMQLQIDVNNVKSTIFLELLNLFKKDNMINDYKIIDDEKTTYDDEVLSDLSMIGDSLRDAKNGLGNRTSTIVNIQDV
jgi:hypothetical protein